jgi:hypothetical protein
MIEFIGTSITITFSYDGSQSVTLHDSFPSLLDNSVFWPTVVKYERRLPAHTLNCIERRPSDESLATESESYVTTDGQSASLSWNKAPIWDLRPDLFYYLTVAGLLIWSALSDERTGLSFTIAAGPRQRSHFQVRVP